MKDADAIIEAYRWLGSIFERYDLPKDFVGAFHETDFDYFRFLGHELTVTVFALLLREQRWELVERLLKEPIVVRYMRNRNGPGGGYRGMELRVQTCYLAWRAQHEPAARFGTR